ncbi:MAG: chlorohydrolase family protein [Nitrospinota bacterium]
MKTLIRGGYVVAFDGESHRVYRDGAVVLEGSNIVHAGGPYKGETDREIDAPGKLVMPGLVNTHFHANGEAGGRIIADVGRPDFFQTGYLNYWAVPAGRKGIRSLERAEVGGKYALVELLKSGCTTAVELGNEPNYEDLVGVAGELGIRAYLGPGFSSCVHRTGDRGQLVNEWDEPRGLKGLERACEFVRSYDGAFEGRVRGILNPAQADTCSPELLVRAREAAEELGVPVQIHTAQNLMEFHEILRRYRMTPVEFLADVGLLSLRTLLGHCIITTAHSFSAFPGGRDLEIIAASGSSVAHCPLVFARRGNALQSFSRYLKAGINLSLGTDTYPRDLIGEMRWASLIGKIMDHDFAAATARDVFNAATLGGARALGREDLGRLAPGARADVAVVDLTDLRIGPFRDPIRALVNCASSADVERVIVDGRVVVEDGRVRGVDEDVLRAEVQAEAEKQWASLCQFHWQGLPADDLSPPSFPWG